MYTSTRVVTSFPIAIPTESRPARLRSTGASASLALLLLAYLALCLAIRHARHARTSVLAWLRGLAREQRRARRILITAAAFGVAIALGVSAGGSTLALWNASVPVGSATLYTGSTGITVNGATTYSVPGLTTTQLLPGLSAVSPQVLTITNTGSTPLSIAVGTAVFSDPSSPLAQNSNLAVSIFQSANCAQTVDGSSTAAMTAPIVVAAGASFTACLQMTLSATAPSTVQGLSSTFTIPLVGTQVRNNS